MKVRITRKRRNGWRAFELEDGTLTDLLIIKQGHNFIMSLQINDDGRIEFYNIKKGFTIEDY